MESERVRCATWTAFKAEVFRRLFDREPFERGVFLFRGQRSADWPLKASFDRWFESLKEREPARVAFSQRLLQEFERHGKNQDVPLFSDSPNRTLALAQHYGLPTRLLDWTESPYTAAFFAFSEALQNPQEGACVAIHALDTRSYAWQGRGVSIVRVPSGGNLRLRNQDGVFTLLESTATTLEEHIAPLPPENPWPLYRFEIPASESPQALSDLDIMGANAARLYPDLQGCCLSAKISVLIGGHARTAAR